MINKKYLIIIGSVCSIISIVLICLIYKSFSDITKLQAVSDVTPKTVEEVLARTIATPLYLVQFIFLILISIISIFISAWMLNKRVSGLEFIFAISLLLFAGAGIPFVVAIIMFIKLKWVDKTGKRALFSMKVNTNFLRVSGLFSIAALIIAPAAIFGYSTALKGVDNPTHASKIVFSSDKKTPNLVEIFTDGFDAKAMKTLLDDDHSNKKDFSDFYGLENFLTPGFITNDSIPTLDTNNYADVNPFMAHYIVDKTNYNGPAYGYEYMKWFPKFAMNKMNGIPYKGGNIIHNTINPQTYNRHLVNPTSLTDADSYMPHVSGNPDYLSNKFDAKTKNKVQIVNWGQAKEDNAGSVGASNLNSDGQFYKWVIDNSISGTKAPTSKGEYLYMQDSLTHTPHNGGKGNVLEWNSQYDKYQKVLDDLKAVINHLKELKVFDNSMIIFYGDHADHSRTTLIKTDEFKDETVVRGNRSFALVKYPNQKVNNKPFEMISDKAYFGPEFNDMIVDAFEGGQDAEKFLLSSKFDINRKFRIYDGSEKTAVTKMVKSTSGTFAYEEIVEKQNGEDWESYSSIKNKYSGKAPSDFDWVGFEEQIKKLAVV